MIDFPTLFPSLVKYIPNWMEKFYPRMAQFARGEGYPCGNKGVFIPRRNKCWTHPKTGNKLKQPLTYQKYQEAKEKSQRSRTEAGRTALQNREQGFRDKAREKVKGWQNKKVEPVKEQSGKIEIKGIETESKTKPVPELLAKRLEKKGFKRSEINIEVRGGKTKIEAMAKGDLAIHPNYKQDEVDGYSVTHIPSGKQFNTFKHGSGYMVNTLKGAENQAVKMIDLIEPLDLKNKDLNSKQLHDVRVGLIQAKWEMDKEGAEKEAKSQEDWDAKEKAEKLPLATEPKPKPEPKPEPKPIAEVKKPERFGDTAYDVDGKWIGYPGDEEKAQKNAANKAKRKAFESDVASFLKENKIDWASSHQHGINTTPARLASLTKILDDKGIEYTTDHSNVWNVKIKIKSLTPKKKDFNAKIKLANFSQPKNKMIDFPSLYPSLVKYIPNWLERFYPSLAQFARGEGYPCGNNGVFIPRRNKCWKHPKTGQRMRKPLTYQNYQDAKEKSQRSRTEKGRTALANREQSFRDKAREKAKGWQNKTPEPEVALKVGTKQVNIVGSPELYKELNLTHDPSLGWQLTNKKGDVLRQPKDGQLQPTHRFKEKSQAENFAKQVIAKVDRMTGKPAEAKMRDTLKKAIADNKLNKSLANTAYEKYHQHQNGMKHQAEGLSSRSVASLYEIPHATAVARINGLREAVGLGPSSAVSVDKELGERINDLLNDGKQIKINSSVGGLRDQKKEPSQTTIGADKKWSDFLESKNVTEKGLRKLDPETRKKITEEFENIRIEERAQESSKRKGLSLPEEPKPTPNSTGVKGAGGKRETDIKDTAPPTPKLKSKDHAANEKYDQWLISESQKLEGKEKNYSIGTESGKKSVRGKVYENFGIHEDRGRYNLTQLSSGKMLSYYDNEDQAKKSIVELNRSGGIDWKTKDLESIPGIQTKMKSVKRKIGAVIESDKRAKELIESMMRSHEKESWDRSDDLAGYGVKVPKKQKNNFNSNLKIANFSQPKNKMIDFPSLYPNLVKYIPNWLERFYPTMAQFARGEGYPCGNNGVFIPRRNKCWKHPKTGQRMRKPLTYQNYQDAKEKSQRSRTEKGRTALANREQSFRDKAREKAKGWQNKTPDSDVVKRAIADIGKVKSGQILLNEKERYRLQHDRGMYLLNDPKLSARQGGVSKKLTEKEATDFLSEQYEKGETKYTPDRSQLGGVGHKLFIDSNTPEGKALLEAEELVKKTKKTSSDHRVAVDFKNVATIDYIAKRSANSPTKEQQEYDNKQPDKIELEKGAGLSEGWRSENAKRRYSGKSEDITAHNDVTGIPWKVTSPGGREDVIVGAKVSDSYGGKERQLTLHKSDGTMSFSPFAKNDKEKENRAKRLVKEITQGKSRNVNIDEINSMINGSKSEPKPTPNSTGVKGAGGKSVDQQYKDIIAKSKDPKRTEEEVSMALMRGLPDFHRDSYNEYSTAIKNNTVPKGYENHYREKVDRFKPVVDNEDFINERRKKAIKGDYETEGEARVYVLNKMKEKGYKEHEYYDSPDYEKDYDKLKGVMKTKDVPPPLSGSVPSKDLRKTLNPGDKLFVKSFVSERLSNPSDYRIADGGEVLKVNIKNVKVRSRGTSLNGKPYDVEGVATLDEISHVIRDGKRYKVDDSDSSPNDLGIPESAKPKAKKRVKKNDFNSNLTLTNFGNSTLRRRKTKTANFSQPKNKMIDFPSLYPSLVKYIPNWLERFYPTMAQFAKGDGYPCGNKGVFIPRRNKCWTHPKTGNKLKQPLTYQKYQEAKEKSQKSRTEKGRTALQNREQSFRDKAREKAKGWQKNKPQGLNSKPPVEPNRETATDKEWAAYEKDYDNYYGKDKDFKLSSGGTIEEQKAERQKEVEQEKQNLFKLLPVGVKRGIADRKNTEIRKRLGIYVDGTQSEKQSQNADDRNSFEKSKLTKDQKKAVNLYNRDIEGTIAHDYLSNRWGSTAQMQRQQGNAPKEGTEQRMGEALYKVKNGEWEAVEGAKTLKERKERDHFNDDGDWIIAKQKPKPDPKPTPNSTGVKDAGGKTFDLNDLWRQTADAAYSKNKDGVSKNLEQWKEVVKKLESGEGISKDVNLNEYEKLMDNLEKKLVLDPKDPSNVEFKKITGSIYRTLNKAVRRDQLTQEDLEKAHPNFRPIMQRMKKTFAKQNELSDKRQQSQKELDLLKHRQSYNESIVRSNSRQFREMGIDNNYNELRLLTKRNPNDMVEVRNPVSNLPERTVTLPERLNEINRDIRDLSDDKKAQISQDRAKEEIARLQKPIKDSEGRVSSLTSEIKALRESRGEPDSPKRKRAKKNDFNSNLKLTQFGGNNLRILKSKLANFAKPGCCCDASKPLKRRKTKQTPRLKRRGNKYA